MLPDIYFTNEWGKAHEETNGGEAVCFLHESTFGKVYYQFIKREIPYKISEKTYYDIITPTGFSGPIVLEFNGDQRELLINEFIDKFRNYCKENSIISEYVRFSPWLENHQSFQLYYSMRPHNYTISIDVECDYFQDEFDRKIRSSVRRAKTCDLSFVVDQTVEALNDFIRLYDIVSKNKNYDVQYLHERKYWDSRMALLGEFQYFGRVYQKNICIGVVIFLKYGDYVHMEYMALDCEYIKLGISSYIYDAVCNIAKGEGRKRVHIGGITSESLMAYKKKLTRTGFHLIYSGEYIHDPIVYDKLTEIHKNFTNEIRALYFPSYRG